MTKLKEILAFKMAHSFTIDDISYYAKALGGVCLTRRYTDFYTPMNWVCEKGHLFALAFANVRAGSWCPRCTKENWRLDRFQKIKEIAESKGGVCLSKKYIGLKYYMKFRCALNHQWETYTEHLLKGHWCPECGFAIGSQKKRKDISVYQKIAEGRGGKLLSKKMISASTNVKWQCSKGHIWNARPAAVKHGIWCLVCAGKEKHTITQMKALAQKHAGFCLSRKYINGATSLKWKCKMGHTWMATPASILRGGWCAECAGVKPLTIENMKILAAEKGGKCLSNHYVNTKSHLLWECKKGHTWMAITNNIRTGTWCPECANRREVT